MDGNYIKTFDSIHDAARSVYRSYSTIQTVLNRDRNVAAGFR